MPRPGLRRRIVRTVLDRAEAARLDKIAQARGIDTADLIAQTLRTLLEAGEQGDLVFGVAVAADDVARLKRMIEQLCKDETEPIDIDEQTGLWVSSFVSMGIDMSEV